MTDVVWELVNKTCEDAATVLKQQAGRYYCFCDEVIVKHRATELNLSEGCVDFRCTLGSRLNGGILISKGVRALGKFKAGESK